MSEQNKPADQEFQIIVDKLLRHKKLIGLFSLAGLIIAGLYTFFVPPVYEARTSIIMPAQNDISGGALGLGKELGILPAGAGGGTNLSMFTAILNSERMLNHLSDQSGIKKKDLRKNRSVTQDDQANLILIRFKNKNSNTAIKLCETSLAALEVFNTDLSLPTKAERSRLIKEKITKYSDDLRDLELRFQQFAENAESVPTGLSGEGSDGPTLFTQKQQLTSLKTQLKSINTTLSKSRQAMSNVAKVGSEIPSDIPQLQQQYDTLRNLERELVAARVTYTKEAPQVISLQAKVDAQRDQIRQEAKKYADSFEKGLVKDINELEVSQSVLKDQIRELEIRVNVAPKEATEYERLKREISFTENNLLQLLVMSEQAQMDETTDPNRWEILDEPELTDKPVNKRFGLSLAIGLLTGLFLSIMIALVKN